MIVGGSGGAKFDRLDIVEEDKAKKVENKDNVSRNTNEPQSTWKRHLI